MTRYRMQASLGDVPARHVSAVLDKINEYAQVEYDETTYTATAIFTVAPDYIEDEWDLRDVIADLDSTFDQYGAVRIGPTKPERLGPLPGEEVTIWPRLGPGESRDTEPGAQPWKAKFVAYYEDGVVIDTGRDSRFRKVPLTMLAL